MTTSAILHDVPSTDLAAARNARRDRTRARIDAALRDCPELRLDRQDPIVRLLHLYRCGVAAEVIGATPLLDYIDEVREEVRKLERWAAAAPSASQRSGTTTRRALCFLRTFGRISALDYGAIPTEDRGALVQLLQLEYRWCFAAAGTTPAQFKIAIGRTGAR